MNNHTWFATNNYESYLFFHIPWKVRYNRRAIRWPENIIPLLQPPHSPELNPIERLWQLLKKSLKNELFSSLQNLRARIQEIFDRLTSDLVISVSSYNFILEALFYAASY